MLLILKKMNNPILIAKIMNMRKLVFALCCAVLFSLGGTVVRADQQAGACVTCHSFMGGELARPVEQWKASVHQQNDITCDLCHGGNADVDLGDINKLSAKEFDERQASAMSKSAGFVGRPVARAMFAMCGQCHDDSVTRYAGSIMGLAYLDRRGGPSCVTCHNAHNNIMPDVPKICKGCHKDTSGYDRIDPMNVTAATINELSRIRVDLAEKKAKGKRPLLPEFPEEMDTYQVGLVAFGAVLVLFLIGCLVYAILEKRR